MACHEASFAHLPGPIFPGPQQKYLMSMHASLKGKSTIGAKRSVLKRYERVELLRQRKQWADGRSVIGLPKTKPNE